ncbi:Hypothetical protein FKW44_022206, partial [Caligus rogercresseyi]
RSRSKSLLGEDTIVISTMRVNDSTGSPSLLRHKLVNCQGFSEFSPSSNYLME